MAEGVQTAASPVRQAAVAAAAPIVLGLGAAFAAWDAPPGTFARDSLFIGSGGLLIAGVAIIVLRRHVPGLKDYFGGLALIALALFAFWASSDLPGMHGFAFGPGTAPRLFATLLAFMGAIVTVTGFLTEDTGLERYAVRGPFFIVVATIVFAVAIRNFGLLITSFISILISAAGTSEVKWLETLIWSAALTAFCAVLFHYLLGLPIPLWPQNLTWATMFTLR